MTDRTAPPWMRSGGVSTLDQGAYGAQIASLRRVGAVSEAQVQEVIDQLVQARLNGADLSALDPMAPPAARMEAFRTLIGPALLRGSLQEVGLSDSDTLQRLFDATIGWGPVVQPILDDPSVTEVKVIGVAGRVTVLAHSSRGRIIVDAGSDGEGMRRRVQALAQIAGLTWDQANPSITIPLGYKTRLHATRAPLVPDGALLLVFRRGRTMPWTLDDLVQRGTLDAATAEVVTALVRQGASILIAGPQDSGKTTLLECLINALPSDRHVILVEDWTDEFQLQTHLVTRLQVAGRQGDGVHGVAPHYIHVVRETLRMTPDLLAPGEVRGAEAAAILQMCETGRPIMTTVHAGSPSAAVQRMARLACAASDSGLPFTYQSAMQALSTSFHLVIQMRWSMRLGRRVVTDLVALDGCTASGDARLVPLVTLRVPDDGADPSWEMVGGDVAGLWDAMPERVRDLRRHALPETGGYHAQAAPATMTVEQMLAMAKHALNTMRTPHAAVQLVDQAYRMAPDHAGVWGVLEQASARHPEVFATLERTVMAQLTAIEAAFERLDLAGATAGMADVTASASRLFVAHRSGRWDALVRRRTEMAQAEPAARQALATAWTLARDGRYEEAMRALGSIPIRATPWALAHDVVQARAAVAQAWELRLAPEQDEERRIIQRYRTVIGADQRWLEALASPDGGAGVRDARPDGADGGADGGTAPDWTAMFTGGSSARDVGAVWPQVLSDLFDAPGGAGPGARPRPPSSGTEAAHG